MLTIIAQNYASVPLIFLWMALPISNTGTVVSASAMEMMSSFVWNVPGSMSNTCCRPGR